MVGFFKYLIGGLNDAQERCWTRLSWTHSDEYHQQGWWWHILSGKKERVMYLRHTRNPIFQRKEVDKWNVEVLSEKRPTIFHLCTSWFASGKASQNFQRKTLQVRKSGKKTSAKPYIVQLPYHSETELQSQLKLLAHFCSHRHQKDADFLSSIRAFI